MTWLKTNATFITNRTRGCTVRDHQNDKLGMNGAGHGTEHDKGNAKHGDSQGYQKQ